MIKMLSVAEAHMKDKNKSLYNMNLATESAKRFKTE